MVTWGNSDLGGNSSVNFAANPIQGMSGASSGSACTVNCAANTGKKIGSATLTVKDAGGNTVSGTFITGADGTLDTSSLSDGVQYTASYQLSSSQTASIINATDVSIVLDISLSGSAANAKTTIAKVAGDTNGDGKINATDVSNVLDHSLNANTTATVALRDASASDPFASRSFSLSSGTDLTLSGYALGDLNGTFADIL